MLKNQAGFTLIELMVTVVIMTVLMSFMLANYNTGGAAYRVENATQEVASLVRKAEAFSNASKKFSNQLPGGYGVSFGAFLNPVLYADLNSNRRLDAATETVETLKLPQGIVVKSTVPSSPVDLFFEPPKRDVFINGVTSSNGAVAIEVNDPANKVSRILNISTHGEIFTSR